MKKFFVIVSLLTTGIADAQTVTNKAKVTFGPEEEAKRSTLNTVFARGDEGYFITRTQKNDMAVELVDYDLKTAKSILIKDMDYQKGEREYYKTFMLGNEIYLITSFKNREKDQFEYFTQTINRSTFSLNNDLQSLVAIPYKSKGLMGISSGGVSVTSSENFSKLLVFNDYANDKKEKESFNCQVFESGMKKLWEKKIEIPYMSDLFSVLQRRIDENGNVYLMGIEYADKSQRRESKRSGTPSYKYHVLAYRNQGNEVKDFEVKLEGKFITDLQMAIDKNGDLVAAGFYSEHGTYSIKGAFYMLIDGNTREVKKSSSREFTFELLTENMTEKQQEKVKKKVEKGKNVELYEYDLDDIKLRDDGSATLIGEQFYIRVVITTTVGANGQSTTRTTTHYYYNDIIVVNIGKDGDILWSCRIPKLQHSIDDGGFYSSYVYAEYKNKLYFIFNDHPENIMNPQGKMKSMGRGKEIAVAFVELDEKGKFKKEMLFSQERRDMIVRPKVCRDAKEGEFFLFAERGKSYQFSRVVIK